MNITKLGHCALVLEVNGRKVLTDPGNFTAEAQEALTGLAIILITHEHGDHMHMQSVEKLVSTNPSVVVVSNASVAKLLEADGIACTIVGDGQATEVNGVRFEGFGTKHAEIYGEFGQVENTGYFVDGTFYFPGDNFHNPGKQVDVLALPVAGPWMKISEAVNFAKEIKARTAFGVHDGMIAPGFRSLYYRILSTFVGDTEFVEIKDGESHEF